MDGVRSRDYIEHYDKFENIFQLLYFINTMGLVILSRVANLIAKGSK